MTLNETGAAPPIPPEFQKLFRELVVAFQPRGLPPDTMATYYDALKVYPFDVVSETARMVVTTRRFFPSLAEWVIPTKELASRRQHWLDHDTYECEWCSGYGLIKINYQSGDPFDLAICVCLGGMFYREAGADLVRLKLNLGPDNQVAYLEDFDDERAARAATTTRTFNVYVLLLGPFVKIGFSTNLARRYGDLSSRVGREGDYIGQVALTTADDARLLERWLHAQFGKWRLDGEWFQADPALVDDLRRLFADRRALAQELRNARLAKQQLAKRPAQQNYRVIAAVAVDVVKHAPVEVPVEQLNDLLLAKCAELKIAADADIAARALRDAEYRLRRPTTSHVEDDTP